MHYEAYQVHQVLLFPLSYPSLPLTFYLFKKTESIAQLTKIWTHTKHKRFKLTAMQYTQFLKQCQTPYHLELGQEILHHIQHNLSHKQIDTILRTTIALSLMKCGNPALAVGMWANDLPVDRQMYTAFLMACVAAGRYIILLFLTVVFICYYLLYNRFDIGKEIHKHMEMNKFQMGPEVLSHLATMYTKFNEPEQVQKLWNIVIKDNVNCNTILYNTILIGCADWAKKCDHDISGTLSPSLQLGKSIHKHMIKSRIVYVLN